MNADLDPTLLSELRELHQSERAPIELERSVLERLLPSRARGKAPLGVRLRAWWRRAPLGWTALGATLSMAALGALYLGAQAFSVEPTRALGPEPRSEAAGGPRKAAHCPLDDLPPGFAYEATRMDFPNTMAEGLQLDTFAVPIPGCPALVRRTLSYVPHALSVPSRAPVLIVLHEGGDSAEGVRALQAQGSFEALAERERFIVVYANAAPASGRFPSSGFWQTDPGANRAIDDFAYLARVVERLGERGLIEPGGSGPDVYLVGYGSGARLALEAAAQHPERYDGVAALLPDKINRTRPPPRRADTRLARLLFLTLENKRPWAYWPGEPLDIGALEEWVVAVGLPRFSAQHRLEKAGGDPASDLADAMTEAKLAARQLVPSSTQLFDFGEPETRAPAVRVLVVQSKAAINVGPGGGPAPVDGATLAWEFLRGAADKAGAPAL